MIIIGLSLLWVAFFSVTPMPKWLDFKPFNCTVCLSFWSIFVSYLAANYFKEFSYIFEAIAIAGAGAYLSIIAKRFIFKI